MTSQSQPLFSYSEKPPRLSLLLLSLQYSAILASWLFVSLAIVSVADISLLMRANALSVTLMACGIVTFIQARGIGRLGAREFIPPSSNPAYSGASMLAVESGGMSLLHSMTVFSGLFEMLVSPLMRWINLILPKQYAGLIIILIGLEVSNIGATQFARSLIDSSNSLFVWTLGISSVLAVTIIQIVVQGRVKHLAFLIVLVVGYIIYTSYLGVDPRLYDVYQRTSWLVFPQLQILDTWSFDSQLIMPFVMASMICLFKVIASLSVMQEMRQGHSSFKGPDFKQISRGGVVDGFGTFLSGLFGGTGINASSTCVALSVENGISNKYIGYITALITVMFAFSGKLMLVMIMTPAPVLGTLLFSLGATLVISGLSMSLRQVISNKTSLFIFCFALVAGLSRGIFPDFYESLPLAGRIFTGSEIVVGTVTIILANSFLQLRTLVLKLFSTA